MTTFKVGSEGSGFSKADQTIGPKRARSVPPRAATRALAFQLATRPSDRATIRPKRLRLLTQTHSEPPRVPRISYHWMRPVVSAKALPSTSQGQEISATVR